jgi:glycosyltransferase involved in cell wall biosynthesis
MLERALAEQLSIVIPAHNEEAAIAVVLDAVRRDCPGAEVIVVDDASRDGTAAQVARFADVRLVRLRYNRGQGHALKTGMRLATRTYVAWFDGDNEHRTEDLVRLVERIAAEDLVAVIGQRATASTSLVRAAGKAMIRTIGRGLKIRAGSDLNCGLRVFRRDIILRYLPMVPDRFSASLMTTLIMLERRYPIEFVPVATNPRIGASSVRLKDGFEAILMLLRAIMIFAPIRVFFPFGLWLAAIGLVYGFAIFFARRAGFPVGAMLMVVVGLLSMMLGLIADQISQMQLSRLSESAPPDTDGPSDRPPRE